MPGIELDRKWDAYVLTTAHILYGMPDHPSLLQSYIPAPSRSPTSA